MSKSFSNSKVFEASMAGGLSPDEANDSAQLESEALESSEYRPSDIPALGSYVVDGEYADQVSIPIDDHESYVETLLDDPGDFIPDWDFRGMDFESLSSTVKAKRDEYTIRTLYAFEESLDQEFIDETMQTILGRPNYKHHTVENSDDGDLALVIGQYTDVINHIVDDEDIFSEALDVLSESPESVAVAAANLPVDELPEEAREKIYIGGDELSEERINTRLRKMQGAGKCPKLENRHEEVLLGEEPTKNTTLIALDDEIVGSLKHKGNTAMLGLKDITFEGRQLLQKGMAYRASHSVIEELGSERIEQHNPRVDEWQDVLQPERMNDEQDDYEEWEISNTDRLEVRPLRFAGQKSEKTLEEFRQEIEQRRQELQELL